MKLALFIHDFFLEIGHGRAIIEKLKPYPHLDQIDLVVFCFTSAPIQELIPGLKGSRIVYFPLIKRPWPFLLKSILFQIFSWYCCRFLIEKDRKIISVGIASLEADLVEIPFLHEHYQSLYLKNFSSSFIDRTYKKIMYTYDAFMEKKVYQKPHIKLFSVSNFMSQYLEKNICPQKKVTTIYHGINQEHFKYADVKKNDVLTQLLPHYPQLSKIDLKQEIFLFVGALERKGVYQALKLLETQAPYQIIIIGSGEKEFYFKSQQTIVHIESTKEMHLFYQLSDSFIFPTIYEPFGLVLLEAAAMGLRIYSNQECVGAFEIISSLEQVHSLDLLKMPFKAERTVLSLSQKRQNALSCEKILQEHSWDKASKEFFKLLE